MNDPREPNTSQEIAREPNTEFLEEESANSADREPNTESVREPNTKTDLD
jgi:hypothetical protein